MLQWYLIEELLLNDNVPLLIVLCFWHNIPETQPRCLLRQSSTCRNCLVLVSHDCSDIESWRGVDLGTERSIQGFVVLLGQCSAHC